MVREPSSKNCKERQRTRREVNQSINKGRTRTHVFSDTGQESDVALQYNAKHYIPSTMGTSKLTWDRQTTHVHEVGSRWSLA